MKVTYINHSGFLLEWENCYWIFDYYKGEIPQLDVRKEVFVFSSHSHPDHFEPMIFKRLERHPKVTYVLSNEIKQKYKKMEKEGRKLPEVKFLRSRNSMTLQDQNGNTIQIFGLQSTDCGCAFLITYQGKTIYHAGDLHWWYWSGEPEDFNKKMTADFKAEMRYLEGKEIDLVFTPLDPRQGTDYALGMNYILQQAKVKHVFPMHFWNDHSVCERYLEEYNLPEHTTFYSIKQDGQNWELD